MLCLVVTKLRNNLNILITGITGFVGGHLEQLLIKNDYEVTGLVRSKKNLLNAKTQVHLVDDINTCDFDSLTKGYDVVIHLAALVHQPDQSDISAYMRLNYDVTIALAQACTANKVKKFITLSTSHVYEGANSHFVESCSLAPLSPYAQSKYKATQALVSIFSDTDTSWHVIRPPLIYGKGVKGNLNSLSKLVSKLSLIPFKSAVSARSYIYVGNLCDFILHLINHNIDSGIYNVSDHYDLSTKELCELIAKAQNKKIIQLPVPRWIMKTAFQAIGRKDHYEKIYGEFRLNIDKALATGWKPKAITYRDFQL